MYETANSKQQTANSKQQTANSKQQTANAWRNLKTFLSLCLTCSLISCQTITVSPEGRTIRLAAPPDYQKTQHFFLGGLIGEAVVPAGEICGDRSVVQMQSQTTFLDGLWPVLAGSVVLVLGVFGALGFIQAAAEGDLSEEDALAGSLVGTALIGLGYGLASLIYTPKTAKVWCGKKVNMPVSGNQSEEAI